MPNFAEVILPLALPANFTYRIPEEFSSQVVPGIRVTVPVGKRKQYTAVVYKILDEFTEDITLKDILRVEDEYPLVNQIQLQFWSWLASYYMCSMGEVMNAALPAGLKLESETLVIPNQQIEVDESILSDYEFLILEALEQQYPLSIGQINEITDLKNSMRIIHLMLGKHLVLLQEEMKGGYQARTRKMIRINPGFSDEDLNAVFDQLERAPRQKEFLMAYFMESQQSGEKTVPAKRILKRIEGGDNALRSLASKEIIKVFEEEIGLVITGDYQAGALPDLNEHQQRALTEIKRAGTNKQVTLLHGVTSSGKTEIYAHLIREALDQSKQVLFLVPEIALTTQLITRLKRYFGERLLVYHSRFSDRERI